MRYEQWFSCDAYTLRGYHVCGDNCTMHHRLVHYRTNSTIVADSRCQIFPVCLAAGRYISDMGRMVAVDDTAGKITFLNELRKTRGELFDLAASHVESMIGC